jgi:hypothetical protein
MNGGLGGFIYKQVRRIPLELQQLFAEFMVLDRSAVPSTKLTDAFGWKSSEVRLPQLCPTFTHPRALQLFHTQVIANHFLDSLRPHHVWALWEVRHLFHLPLQIPHVYTHVHT